MRRQQAQHRGAARAQVSPRFDGSWILGIATAVAVTIFGVTLARSQSTVPDVVKPQSESPTLPPSGADRGLTKPIPDTGVITPPAMGETPVIRPPMSAPMPVIPPPGTSGGSQGVVPK